MPRLAVLGHPVAHSRSPAMQNAALAELGLAEEWSYEAIDVAPEEFEARVASWRRRKASPAPTSPSRTRERRWRWPTRRARRRAEIGAANTLSFAAAPTGCRDRRREHRRRRPARLAAGLAAGRAGAGARRRRRRPGGDLGAGRARAPRSRSGTGPRRAPQAVAAELGGSRRSPTPDARPRYDLIVNTTAVGLRGEDPFEHLPLAPDGFDAEPGGRRHGLRRDARAPLLAAAGAAGATTVDGLEILVQQGALSLELWTGRKAPLEVMRAAARG